MGAEEQDAGREARIEEIRAKIERGEEPSPEDRAYALSEGLEIPGEEGAAPPAV